VDSDANPRGIFVARQCARARELDGTGRYSLVWRSIGAVRKLVEDKIPQNWHAESPIGGGACGARKANDRNRPGGVRWPDRRSVRRCQQVRSSPTDTRVEDQGFGD